MELASGSGSGELLNSFTLVKNAEHRDGGTGDDVEDAMRADDGLADATAAKLGDQRITKGHGAEAAKGCRQLSGIAARGERVVACDEGQGRFHVGKRRGPDLDNELLAGSFSPHDQLLFRVRKRDNISSASPRLSDGLGSASASSIAASTVMASK